MIETLSFARGAGFFSFGVGMKIRVVVTAEPEKRKVVTVVGDVAQDGDLTRIVSEAIAEARKQGVQSWGWSLSVEKAE